MRLVHIRIGAEARSSEGIESTRILRSILTLRSSYVACILFIHQGESDMLSALLGAGAHVDLVSEQGWSPLHLAAKESHRRLEPVQLLLQSGCPPELEDNEGCTALHYAALR